MRTILVTGVSGFVGRHMVEELARRGCAIIGVGHRTPPAEPVKAKLQAYFSCDVTNASAVQELPLEKVDAVINLAGLARVGASFDDPELYKQTNVAVLTVLGEALLTRQPKARLLAISSGAVYDPNQPLPLTETSKLVTDGSPYALSKILMEQAAADLRQRGLDCVVARPFNHIGPGQETGFLVPDLYQDIRAAQANGAKLEKQLSTSRDYTDVRDVARAYADLALAEQLSFDTYNVCSGHTHSGEDILRLMLRLMDAEDVEFISSQEPQRANDPAMLCGDYARLQQETGWQPRTTLEKTLQDYIAEERLLG